jgi:hypothetical protein
MAAQRSLTVALSSSRPAPEQPAVTGPAAER